MDNSINHTTRCFNNTLLEIHFRLVSFIHAVAKVFSQRTIYSPIFSSSLSLVIPPSSTLLDFRFQKWRSLFATNVPAPPSLPDNESSRTKKEGTLLACITRPFGPLFKVSDKRRRVAHNPTACRAYRSKLER